MPKNLKGLVWFRFFSSMFELADLWSYHPSPNNPNNLPKTPITHRLGLSHMALKLGQFLPSLRNIVCFFPAFTSEPPSACRGRVRMRCRRTSRMAGDPCGTSRPSQVY